jgi:2-C-methyl-D-erythritol 4-phosphate cytidylyltransferase
VKKYAIIVAGGRGNRFESKIPKQFVELAGKPILMRSIESFHCYGSDIEIIVVLPGDQIEYWKRLCEKYQFKIKHHIVAGGDIRFYSVKNGLELIKLDGLVAIHDGVRPLIDLNTINKCFEVAGNKGNAIPVVDLVDSIRELKPDGSSQHIDRNKFKLIQTPQVFQTNLILKAYEQEYSNSFTDDASVLEAMLPGTIQLVEGNRRNIKITTTEDLKYAEAIFKDLVS